MGLFGRKSKTEDGKAGKDPVCGMTVEPAKAAGTAQHDGQTFLFCSKGCLAKFNADPHRYGH